MVNDRMFQGKQAEQLAALWAEATHFEKCHVVVAKGERVGQQCGKACVKGKDTCMCHQPRIVKEKPAKVVRERCGKDCKKGKCIRFVVDDTGVCAYHQPKSAPVPCEFHLLSGLRKNESCGKPSVQGTTICKRHSAEKKEKQEKVSAPTPVVEKVSAPMPVVEKVATPKPVVEKISAPMPVLEKVATPKSVVQKVVTPKPIAEKPVPVAQAAASEHVQTCDSVMKSGTRKGLACGKKCATGQSKCVLHV